MLRRATVTRAVLGSCFTLLVGIAAFSQARPTKEQTLASFRTRSADFEQKGLAEPYKGITANGQVESGLFPIRSTGVSTEPVQKAAEALIARLTPEQQKRSLFSVDDPEWRKWMNQHFYIRQGVSFEEMDESQRGLAFGLLKAALSARGLRLTKDIMHLNQTLAELSNDFDFLGEWKYFITVMGKPSATEPWGFQLDGHHVIINYFVLGDQVVMTPFFVGSEPVRAESGKYKGTVILQDEQNRGLAMLNALNADQKQQAILNSLKTENNNLTEAFKDNVVLDYAGAKVSGFSAAQKKQLTDLIDLYVGNMDDGHTKVKMADVKKHLDRTTFAWIGASEPTSVFYYRIQSPVILIEFDHQRPANLSRMAADPKMPVQQHIHVVVRTPNGNDYGKDLLRQHLLQHPHS